VITRRQTLAGAAATSLLPSLFSQTARSKEAPMTDTIIVNAKIALKRFASEMAGNYRCFSTI
jgi:hypothetical protein